MKKNMGFIDRLIRVAIAIIIVTLYGKGILTGTLGIVLIGLSVILILTSMVRFCPIYLPFGLSTIRKRKEVNN